MKNLRGLITSSILVTLGFVLHYITPPILGGMKPDFVIIAIVFSLLFDPTGRNAVLISLLAGVLTALSTAFPGGQVANLVDKLVTTQFALLLIHLLKPDKKRLLFPVIVFMTTAFSGFIFLSVALLFVGSLPAAFSSLYLIVVLPTAIIDAVIAAILHQALILFYK